MGKRRWLLVAVGAAVVVALAVGLSGPPDVTNLRPDDVVGIEVRPRLWTGPTEEPSPVRSDDPAVVAAVLSALRPVGEPTPHGCSPPVTLIVHRRSRPDIELMVLPGHDPRFYEYKGGGGWRQVDRAGFLVAMKLLGADWVPATCP